MRTAGLLAVLLLAVPDATPQVDELWDFAMGQPSERLEASAGQMPARRTRVALPHRVQAANTALWYSRAMVLPPGSAIEVSADDGAQVFVDDRRLRNHRRFFEIPPDLTGRRLVTVRVLNNAMQGGLRRFAIVDRPAARPREPAAPSAPPAGFERVDSPEFLARMPARDAPCPFTAWADSQGGLTTFRRIVDLMASRRPAFSVGVGDLVSEGADPDAWPAFVDVLAPLARTSQIVPIAGNHDYVTGGAGGGLEDAAAEALGTSAERIVVRHHFLHATATPASLTVDAIDLDGALLDRVVLRRGK